MPEIVSKPDLADISQNLRAYLEEAPTLYLTWDEDLTDFRLDRSITVRLHSRDNTVVVTIPKDRKYLCAYVGMLCTFAFDKSKVTVIWDAKPFFTYLRHRIPRHWGFPVCGHILHLSAGERFCGVKMDEPPSFEEAVKRASIVMKNDAFIKVNTNIYTPLAVEVLPGIETLGLPSKEGRLEYCYYRIEGQKNGRLGCNQAFDGCFVPQAMDDEKKRKYSAGAEKKFMSFDYKHMEVSVLQWLSQDKRLGSIIDSGEDIYSAIYQIVSGSTCPADKRKWMKEVFISIIYGMQAKSLAEKTGFSIKGAEALLEKVYSSFPTAMEWLHSQQSRLKTDVAVKDQFGRVLDFGEDSDRTPWSIQNATIQSPTALVCLEKLIRLYQNRLPSMEVVASIHDAYVCAVEDVEVSARYGKEILESSSILAPELKLKVDVKVGDSWGDLAMMNVIESTNPHTI